MPASYAHYRFGKEVLPGLPGTVRQSVQRFRRMYDLGLQGPDPLFYHNFIWKDRIDEQGYAYHRKTGREFFTEACKAADSEAARVYLYGVLGHYCLDAACHPFVNAVVQRGEAGHVALESEFDRYLLSADGEAAPHTYSIGKHLKLTRGECMTVASFYPPVTGAQIRQCVRLMVFGHNYLAGGDRQKREKLVRRLNATLPEHMIPTQPVPEYTRMVSELLARYNRCVRAYPELLAQLQALLDTGAPLGEEFDRTF